MTPELFSQTQTTEIKILLEASAWKKLDLKLKNADREKVYFLDTLDHLVEAHDLVLRVRASDDNSWESTVKLRPLRGEIPKEWHTWKRFKHESDIVGSRVIDSAAYTRRIFSKKKLLKMLRNQVVVPGILFSPKQLQIIRSRFRDLDFRSLKILGPVDAYSWTIDLEAGLKGKIERWTVRGHPEFEVVELSVKVPDFYSQCHSFLRGLMLKPLSNPKTKTSLVTALLAR